MIVGDLRQDSRASRLILVLLRAGFSVIFCHLIMQVVIDPSDLQRSHIGINFFSNSSLVHLPITLTYWAKAFSSFVGNARGSFTNNQRAKPDTMSFLEHTCYQAIYLLTGHIVSGMLNSPSPPERGLRPVDAARLVGPRASVKWTVESRIHPENRISRGEQSIFCPHLQLFSASSTVFGSSLLTSDSQANKNRVLSGQFPSAAAPLPCNGREHVSARTHPANFLYEEAKRCLRDSAQSAGQGSVLPQPAHAFEVNGQASQQKPRVICPARRIKLAP